ncbi:4,5-DOPA dioxygenase extradiol [Methanobacterium sp.]|uniref:4,5-DOPA-extradiol-dioxygenase n=1 Tax=Methanobacterium sp. TaxID=2164 RepID=UPI0031598D57
MNYKKVAMNQKIRQNNEKMPVLFIGHGSPINVISDNDFTRSLVKLGQNLPKPMAILVVSAHWLTDGTYVTCMDKPKTIHDFYGFPEKMYEITYPSPGAPDCAKFLAQSENIISCSTQWGLDHASWAVLKHMYPQADIPVFEMSLDYSFNDRNPKPVQYHYDLASKLKVLREKGVLIMGSGNIVHNLGMADYNMQAKPYDWAVEFDQKVKSNLLNGNVEDLINFENMGSSALYAVPTLDHYLPMIYSIALRDENEPVTFTYEGFQNGSISMRCFQIG